MADKTYTDSFNVDGMTNCNGNIAKIKIEKEINSYEIFVHRDADSRYFNGDETAYVCDLWGKRFNDSASLNVHMQNKHTLDRGDDELMTYVCDVCGQGFSESSSLDTHKSKLSF